jgi:hypothetical protein
MSGLIKLAGAIIIIDGVASIIYSEDQRAVSNTGRVIRSIIGVGLVIWG